MKTIIYKQFIAICLAGTMGLVIMTIQKNFDIHLDFFAGWMSCLVYLSVAYRLVKRNP